MSGGDIGQECDLWAANIKHTIITLFVLWNMECTVPRGRCGFVLRSWTGQGVLLTDLAVVALPAVAADALVHADFVDAGASVAAWVTLAVVDV